jgi:phosphoribosylanthranilate isomerase
MIQPVIKICGINSAREAHMALAAGANFIGFVSEGLTPPGCFPDEEIVSFTEGITERSQIVLLTPHSAVEEVVAQQRLVRAGALQLCHPFEVEALRCLREELPGVLLIQVVHMGDEGGLKRAVEASKHADVVLLDSGTTAGENKVFGGTGETHDWSQSAAIVAALDVPVWLAGGLSPSNISSAISMVKPSGLDVCSSLRPSGSLDAKLLESFIQVVRA